MINSQKLLKIARKWCKLASIERRRTSACKTDGSKHSKERIKSVAEKDHFVVYTADGRRFMIPLAYLNSPIFIELLKMSEEQFGLPCDGPITMPCNAIFMEYAVSLIKRPKSRDCSAHFHGHWPLLDTTL